MVRARVLFGGAGRTIAVAGSRIVRRCAHERPTSPPKPLQAGERPSNLDVSQACKCDSGPAADASGKGDRRVSPGAHRAVLR